MENNILLIEDEESIGQVLKDFMKLKGFNVIWKTNGREALEEALKNKYDLILLDVNLPEVNGFEICRKIRERPNGEIVPIIMITVFRQFRDKLKGLSYGADEYITKPFDFDELFKKVNEVIEEKKKILEKNPITGLPGFLQFKAECEKLKGKNFYAGYVYSDNFNNFIKLYGNEKAKQFIKKVSDFYKENFEKLFHLGNMQFYFITDKDVYKMVGEIVKEKKLIIKDFYNETDFERGYSVIQKPLEEGIIDNIRFYTTIVSLGDKREFKFEDIMDDLINLYKLARNEESCFIFESGEKFFYDNDKRKILFFSGRKFLRTYFKKMLEDDNWRVSLKDKLVFSDDELKENSIFIVDSDIDFAKKLKQRMDKKRVFVFKYEESSFLKEITEKGLINRSPYFFGLKVASFLMKGSGK